MKIVVIGSGGRLGSAFMREFSGKFEVIGFNHAQLDLANLEQVQETLAPLEFDVLINAAAFTNVDLCETQRDQAFRINAEAPRALAEICRDKNAKLIHFSTDYVFDGEKREPYTEGDAAKPISVYGESKRAGEEKVLAAQDRPVSRLEGSRLNHQSAGSPSSFNSSFTPIESSSVEGAAGQVPVRRHLIVRVSWVFGPDRPSFVDTIITRAKENEEVNAVADKFSTPTYTRDIAKILPKFFDVDVAGGILHFANAGECSWQEYAQHALDCCRASGLPLKAKKVGASKLADMKNWVARRPRYSVLSTAKYAKLAGVTPRSWRDVVSDYIERSYSKK